MEGQCNHDSSWIWKFPVSNIPAASVICEDCRKLLFTVFTDVDKDVTRITWCDRQTRKDHRKKLVLSLKQKASYRVLERILGEDEFFEEKDS